MKPRNWRTYYGFRPNYAYLGVIPDKQIRAQEANYVAWLAKARGVSEDDAETYARSQIRVEPVGRHDSQPNKIRSKDYVAVLGPNDETRSAIIRTVRVYHTREHYEFSLRNTWSGQGAVWHWHKLPKPDAPTTYAVFIGGRCVNSFLTKARAKQWAIEHLKAAS